MKKFNPLPKGQTNLPPIALLAGRGELPRLLIDIFQSQSRPFVVLAFKNQTEEALVKDIPHLWVSFGEVGKVLHYLGDHQIRDIVMAGAISRPALSDIRPDWEGVKWLARIGTKVLGDDALLKSIMKMIEEQGYRVIAPNDIIEDLLAPEGVLTSLEPDEQAWRDIGRGVEILIALSPVDVGQAVIIQEGLVLGIETIEGTDALIERASALQRPGPKGVLVKIAKCQQDQRVDLPTIGPTTILKAAEAGLRGVAIQAGQTLLLKREESIYLAQEKGLFLASLGHLQCRRPL